MILNLWIGQTSTASCSQIPASTKPICRLKDLRCVRPVLFFAHRLPTISLLPHLNLPLDVLPPHLEQRTAHQHVLLPCAPFGRPYSTPLGTAILWLLLDFSDLAQPPPSCLPHHLAAALDVSFVFISAAFAYFFGTPPRTTCQGERPCNKPDFSSSGLSPAESAAASRRRKKRCTQDGLESQMGGRQVRARHGGGTTESFGVRSGHDRRGDMDGLKSDSAPFWSRCIFFHESTTPTRQNRETKKSNNQVSKQTKKSESSACCRRHQLLSKRQHTPCVLSVSATSRVRVTCAAIAFPRSVPVREGSDDCRGETPRFADGNFQPFVNFVQGMECPFV